MLSQEALRALSDTAVSIVQGQLHAVWTHRVSKREAATIVQAQIPVLVLHGRHDILAMPWFGEQLARRLGPLSMLIPCVALAFLGTPTSGQYLCMLTGCVECHAVCMMAWSF